MEFFQKLAEQGDTHIVMNIFIKDGKYTMSVMPGNATSKQVPLNLTGTPQELDEQFFSTVYPVVSEIAGLKINSDEAVASAKAQATPAKKEEKKSKPEKAQKPVEKKKSKEPEVKMPSLLDTPAEENDPAPDQTGDDGEQQ